MKVSYPLSLKVSLWLALNLLLLAALGVGFFVAQGGLGWSALVAGPSGDRAQSLVSAIAGEAAAASGEARHAVLKRFGDTYGVEFMLFGFGETQLAGRPADLPAAVRERLELRGGLRGFGIRGGPGTYAPPREGEADGSRRREQAERMWREGKEKGGREMREPPDRARPPPELARKGDLPFAGPVDWRAPRFILRTDQPSAYWIGLRVPFVTPERGGRTPPALLVARVGSLWKLLHLIGLEAWFLAAGGVLALAVLCWLPLVRSITRPLAQLTAATGRIAEGRLDTRVDASRRDELGRLGESVNRMAVRLDAQMTGQKRFLGDVAHELCSPIARLQLATGILAERAPNDLRETVADVRDEVQQMSTLVNELLAFTKAGMQTREVELKPVPLPPLAQETLAREDPAGKVNLEIPDGMVVRADAALLARALGNLVRNALRYAGDSGPVQVAATREGGQVVVTVDDDGPGVPPADLDRLGEPFFRPELARTREGGGVGLGLAIVRTSIAPCGGEVRFSNRAPRGFRAEIRLSAA
ncbi:MAG: sensor histidine kinase [Opitutaceae bacterium]